MSADIYEPVSRFEAYYQQLLELHSKTSLETSHIHTTVLNDYSQPTLLPYVEGLLTKVRDDTDELAELKVKKKAGSLSTRKKGPAKKPYYCILKNKRFKWYSVDDNKSTSASGLSLRGVIDFDRVQCFILIMDTGMLD